MSADKENSVGNWRSHILVKCLDCQRPMGYHLRSTVEICIDCTLKGYGAKK